MRATWTDERLDDLKDEVVRQGGRIDALGERLDGRIDALGERIDAQGERLDAMGERLEVLNQTILTFGGRLFAGFLAIAVAIIGLIATQL